MALGNLFTKDTPGYREEAEAEAFDKAAASLDAAA